MQSNKEEGQGRNSDKGVGHISTSPGMKRTQSDLHEDAVQTWSVKHLHT